MDQTYILESKTACRDVYHLNPLDLPIPKTKLSIKELNDKRLEYSEIRLVSKFFINKLLCLLEGIPILMAISDDKGYLLETFGDESITELIQTVGYVPGVLFTEEDVGTTSLTLALSRGVPVQVIGDDHYHKILKESACFSVPFSFSHPVPLKGTFSIMTSIEHKSQLSLGLLSSVVDSIDRELQLRDKNKHLDRLNHLVIDSTLNGIIITDKAGLITDFNQSAELFTGINKKDLLGYPVARLEILGVFILESLNKGVALRDIYLSMRNQETGEIKWCFLDTEPIRDDSFEIIGAYAHFRDMTEQRIFESKLQAVDKLAQAGRMSAGIAHEIKNPLTPIKGFIKLLEDKMAPESEEARYLSIIYTEIERITGLANQFSHLTKPTEPRRILQPLTPIISDTITLMKAQACLYNITIDYDESHELQAEVDANQIKQVLQNLIRNSIEAMPKGGTIRLTLKEIGDEVQILVADQGEGIPNEILSRLSAPFKSTKENGLGIGLSICYTIVKYHNGHLQAIRNTDGGTTFIVSLPRK